MGKTTVSKSKEKRDRKKKKRKKRKERQRKYFEGQDYNFLSGLKLLNVW